MFQTSSVPQAPEDWVAPLASSIVREEPAAPPERESELEEALRELGIFTGSAAMRDAAERLAIAAADLLERVSAAPAFAEPAVGLGKDVRLAGNRLSGAALWAEGRYVHVSAFAAAGIEGRGRWQPRMSRPSRRGAGRRRWNVPRVWRRQGQSPAPEPGGVCRFPAPVARRQA